MSARIIPERLALLPTIHLHRGSHESFEELTLLDAMIDPEVSE